MQTLPLLAHADHPQAHQEDAPELATGPALGRPENRIAFWMALDTEARDGIPAPVFST